MKKSEKIFNYRLSDHFMEQMGFRKFTEDLVALCLAKGKVQRLEDKMEFCLTSDQVMEAKRSKYIDPWLLDGVRKCVIICKRGHLITCFKKFGEI